MSCRCSRSTCSSGPTSAAATQSPGFSPQALAVLSSYDWPGNLARARPRDRPRSRLGDGRPDLGRRVEDLPASIRGNLGAAFLPAGGAWPDQAPRPDLDRGRAAIDRTRAAACPRKQVAGSRSAGNLSPAPLSPDQGAQPAGRGRPPMTNRPKSRDAGRHLACAWESRKSPFTSVLRGLSAFPFLLCR